MEALNFFGTSPCTVAGLRNQRSDLIHVRLKTTNLRWTTLTTTERGHHEYERAST